jgi:shikimate kinase
VDVLWPRLKRKTTRPLLRTPDPKGTLSRLVDERAATYALADVIVDARAELSAAETAGLVHEAIAARMDVLV